MIASLINQQISWLSKSCQNQPNQLDVCPICSHSLHCLLQAKPATVHQPTQSSKHPASPPPVPPRVWSNLGLRFARSDLWIDAHKSLFVRTHGPGTTPEMSGFSRGTTIHSLGFCRVSGGGISLRTDFFMRIPGLKITVPWVKPISQRCSRKIEYIYIYIHAQ